MQLSLLSIVLLKPRARPLVVSFIVFEEPKAKFVFTNCSSKVLVKILLEPTAHEFPDLTVLLKPETTMLPPTLSF